MIRYTLKPPAGFSILREVSYILSPEVQLRAEERSTNSPGHQFNYEESLLNQR